MKTPISVAIAVLLGVAAAAAALAQQAQQDEDEARIEVLIDQLGWADRDVRQKAVDELLRIGEKAIPRLRVATQDKDAERALLARELLWSMRKLPPPGEGAVKVPPPARTSVDYHDWVRGVHFRMEPDGKVELTVPETNGKGDKRVFQTYKADSLSEFVERYPELAKSHNLTAIAGPAAMTKELFTMWSEHWKWLLPGGPAEGERPPKAPPRGEALGALAGPVDEAIRKHLGLAEHQGIMIFGVEKGSLAEKSGLQKHDIILLVDGKSVSENADWPAVIREALKKDAFVMEILRRGIREQVTIRAIESK